METDRKNSERRAEVTRVMADADMAEASVVAARLFPLVYQELRALAAKYLRQERKGHTLQPTALVHEAFLRLIDQADAKWQGKTHFFAVCAQAMRRILIDHVRGVRRLKRGGDWRRVALDHVLSPHLEVSDVDPLDLDAALGKLAALDKRQAQVVELRFFSELTMEEIAEALGVSKRTIEDDWTHAKAWLRAELKRDSQA